MDPSEPNGVLQDALEGFLDGLTETQRGAVVRVTQDDIRSQILGIQNDQHLSKQLVNFTRIKPLLHRLDGFIKVCRSVEMGNETLPGCIWGPLKWIIQVSVGS